MAINGITDFYIVYEEFSVEPVACATNSLEDDIDLLFHN